MKILLPNQLSPLDQLNRILNGVAYQGTRLFLLVDENTSQHCLPLLVSRVERLQEAEFMEVPAGEDCKDPAIAIQLWQSLLESKASRDCVLVNLGGGCVSDLGGFVAAGFKRGIQYINIPTTLIGMVDAAIGGKTGINLNGSKNQVGFFHQPEIICIDPVFLETLPAEELQSGFFEMLKTFMISGSESYKKLCTQLLGGEMEVKPAMIAECVETKLPITKKDPKDHGIRHILNLGHTFGHAIEAYSHECGKPLSHGNSVGIGLIAALSLSVQHLGLDKNILTQYKKVAEKLIPLPHYTLEDTERLLVHMRQDKKNSSRDIRCVLLRELGTPVINFVTDENEIRQTLLKI